MEELAKLEAERGTLGYAQTGGIITNGNAEMIDGHGKGSLTDGSGAVSSRKGKRKCESGGDHRAGDVATFASTLTAVVYCNFEEL